MTEFVPVSTASGFSGSAVGGGGPRIRRIGAVLLGCVVLIPNAFAAYQYRLTHGLLFYSNAFDEPTYLSYDGSLAARSITRLSEYLVVALHQSGMSGGFINVTFDIVFPLAIVILVRLTLLELGFGAFESAVYAVGLVSLPVLFGYSNPYYMRLFDLNYHSRSLSWLTLPQAYYPPMFRTPEPQVSLTVAALATYSGIRWKSFVPPVVVLPVLYPFVAIPYGFISLSLLLHSRLERVIRPVRARLVVSMVGVSLAIATGVDVYYRIAVSGTSIADYLPATRLPLMSGTGAAGVLVYLAFRKRLPTAFRIPLGLFAAAPLVAVNTQVVTGFIQTPHSFEQNFGVTALSAILLVGLRSVMRPVWAMVLLSGISCCLLAIYATHIFAVNSSPWQRLPPSSELLKALRDTPETVVIYDPDLADIFGLAAPALHFSALARSQTALFEPSLTEHRFDNYMCVKQRVSQSFLAGAVPAATFSTLDRSFRYMNQDFPLTHLNRVHTFKQYFDPSQPEPSCSPRDLKMFPAYEVGEDVTGGRLALRLAPINGSTLRKQAVQIVTPAEQWAYAATAELTELVSTVESRLALVRVDATVTAGCVGFGVLKPGGRSFANEVFVNASPAASRLDVTFEPAAQPHIFVVRNCFPGGESTVAIGGVNAFPVKAVTVNTIAAAAAPSNQ